MKRFQLVCLLAGLAAVASLSPAQAQVATQLYVSPAGTGTACSASAPCDLPVAVGKITPSTSNTIISCINGGKYEAPLSFNQSATIDCPGAVLTGSLAVPALTFAGDSSQVVILRNLTFDGADQQSAPLIKVLSGTTLIIENCKFQNLSNSNAIAIMFLPTAHAAQLIIRDSVFANNGIAPGTGGGLLVEPAGSGTASVLMERVSFNYNVTGMVLRGPVNATMIGSTVSASRSNGILVGSGATLDIKDSTLVYNVGAAVSVAAGGTLRLSNNDIKSNQIGVSNSGGQALSYKNNRIVANGSTATLGTIAGGQ